MPKRFQVEILETGVKAVAQLLEAEAPRTCAALWQMLEKPLQTHCVHAMWSGREVMTHVPPENQGDIDPAAIGPENATAYPSAGDVVWTFLPGGTLRGITQDAWDLAFIYGPETRIYLPVGMWPMNVWARIVEGLDAFAAEVSQVRHGVRKTARLSRLQE